MNEAAPASESQIAREEARLGVRLPPSLRSFYLHSNGHGVVGNFIWSVRSVEQVGWLRDVVPELYDNIFEDDAAVARSLVVSGVPIPAAGVSNSVRPASTRCRDTALFRLRYSATR